MRPLVLSLLLAATAAAQAALEAPPPVDAWATASVTPVIRPQDDGTLGVVVAANARRGGWGARLAYAVTEPPAISLGGSGGGLFYLAQTEEGRGATGAGLEAAGPAFEPADRRTLSLGVGPAVRHRFLAASATIGPALTWGDVSGRPATYSRLGVALSGSAQVQLGGAVWAGAEAVALASSGASYVGVGPTLRIDLARAD